MKTLLLLGTIFVVNAAQASTITLDSSALNTLNNSGYATVDIAQNTSWAKPLTGSDWISYDVNGVPGATTGNTSSPGFVVVPNGTSVTFSQTFNLDGTVTSADLKVLADDTTSVTVNGTTIFNATNWGPDNQYKTCSDQTIGCLSTTDGDFGLAALQPYLVQGSNTISFDVVQRNLVSFGLDYAGTITTDPSCYAPEPASIAMLGFGLCGLVLFRKRRRA